MIDLIDVLRLWLEAGSGPGKAAVLEATIEELMRLYRVESAAARVVGACYQDGAVVPSPEHPDVQLILSGPNRKRAE
jgi:hypothetical protein